MLVSLFLIGLLGACGSRNASDVTPVSSVQDNAVTATAPQATAPQATVPPTTAPQATVPPTSTPQAEADKNTGSGTTDCSISNVAIGGSVASYRA